MRGLSEDELQSFSNNFRSITFGQCSSVMAKSLYIVGQKWISKIAHWSFYVNCNQSCLIHVTYYDIGANEDQLYIFVNVVPGV